MWGIEKFVWNWFLSFACYPTFSEVVVFDMGFIEIAIC
jgi:hypothetical protein